MVDFIQSIKPLKYSIYAVHQKALIHLDNQKSHSLFFLGGGSSNFGPHHKGIPGFSTWEMADLRGVEVEGFRRLLPSVHTVDGSEIQRSPHGTSV